jgi:non-homologous end joining protein Ku
MRDGMKGKIGIGKLALYRHEYLVAVRPFGRGIVMHTLHHAAEIRSIDAIDELNSVPAKVRPEEIKLAQQVIECLISRLVCPSSRNATSGGPAEPRQRNSVLSRPC